MIDLNKIAIITKEHDVTYSELLRRVAQFARKTPKGKLTKTVVFSENREGWAYSFFSVWLNEGIVVPIDASSTVSDVAYILSDCKPEAAWVSKEREDILKEAIKEAEKKGSGVIAVNGKMVDRPVVIRAQHTIELAIASGVLKQEDIDNE